MSRTITYAVAPAFEGVKIYDYLRREQHLSYRLITSLKHLPEGILRNGEHARTIDRLRAGDSLSVTLAGDENESEPCGIFVPVAYEDEDVLVYNKPAGMNCHQARRFQNDTLANVFAAHCQRYGLPALTFRCLNRLDKDTTGLVLLAKNQHAAARLKLGVEKEYLALVCGVPTPPSGTVNVPISRVNEVYTKRQADEAGQPAATRYEVLAEGENGAYSLVRLRLETGRTHQIRVHMAYIGCPLAGDDMYGGSTELLARQALHCGRMAFTSPITGQAAQVRAPLPEDIQKALKIASIYSNYE